MTRSGVIPACSARSQPLSSQSSWPGACASVSMANRQPASAACRSRSSGGSWRSGRQLISTATLCSRQAANTASASNSDCGSAAPVPSSSGRCSARARPRPGWRPPQACARSSARPASAAWSARWPRRRRAARAGPRADRDPPSSRMSTSIPLRIRNGASSAFSSSIERELRRQPLGRQPVGDRQARRVIGQRDPLMTQHLGGLRHLPWRAAAVRPVRVGVAVAAQRCPHRGPRRRLVFGLQADQVIGPLTGRGRGDHTGGRWPDSVQILQRAVHDPPVELAGGHPRQHRGGPAKRLHPVRRSAGTLQLEGDPPQRRFRIHPSWIHRRPGAVLSRAGLRGG